VVVTGEGAQRMTIQLFISGVIFGFLLGALFCYVFLQWVSRQRLRGRKREIDLLTQQFQELFRQIDQDKRQSS
jgi:TRAP-type C4-dicarboxylate transport system permease large subunit